MGVLEGCEGINKTWNLEERVCPQCGTQIEVYTSRGRVAEEAVCRRCGYIIKAQERVIPKAQNVIKEEEF